MFLATPFHLTWHSGDLFVQGSDTTKILLLSCSCHACRHVVAQKTCLMRGMIIVIADPNLISNFRNLSICIEGNQNFTSGYLCHAGRPPESCRAPLPIKPHVSHFWNEGGYLRWDVIWKWKWAHDWLLLPKLFIHHLAISFLLLSCSWWIDGCGHAKVFYAYFHCDISVYGWFSLGFVQYYYSSPTMSV